MNTLKFEKLYTRGGGGYKTLIGNIEVTIQKNYSDNSWSAWSSCGEIDIEAEKLSYIKEDLQYIYNKLK
jgi:hypothetical protein